MLFSPFRRFITTTSLRAAEKSLLAALRKQTGYSFSNCKKALELNGNNLEKAQEWLQQQAQTLGWSKATKLEGRQTSQGLIGLMVQNNFAALVELNCETDFVARNENFKDMLNIATRTCFNYVSKQQLNEIIQKTYLSSEKLRNLQASDGKSLGDHLTLMIGNLGENAQLKRGLCLRTENNINLYGYAHPASSSGDNEFMYGKYGAIVALKEQNSAPSDIGKSICQHIVGMNPSKIGVKDVDKPAENVDDETCLIYQELLSNPTYKVHEILEENQIQIIDFVRYECGGDDVASTSKSTDEFIGKEVNFNSIQTCQ